jgi:aerobic-type carbon monoxide dehydrogenase small subunit (CoxS/CutS family)
VLVDGEPARSCRTEISAVQGRKITTIEGLHRDGQLHAVQSAFLEHDAMQCGYCTPGMILSAVGLLSRESDLSEDRIVRALEGNICRCGAYPRIVAAVRAAAAAAGEEAK